MGFDCRMSKDSSLKDQDLLMVSTRGITKAVTFALVFVATFCSTAAGHKFCFQSRDHFNKCQEPLIQPSDPLPPRNSNCCLSKEAMYYVEEDVPNLRLFFLKLFANKGLENCTPCPLVTRNSGTCSRKCPPGKICALRHGKEKCICNRSCHSAQNKSQVCGRDNKTYKHECDLLRKACQDRRENSVAYDGPCQIGCSQVKCRGNYTCITDQYDKAHCISCNTLPPCTIATGGPVCGADGVQYSSSCALRLETCRQGQSIGVAYYGNCVENATCDDINCGDKICVMDAARRPRCISCSCGKDAYRNGHDTIMDQKDKSVCGTDLRTYKSYCSLRRQVCANKTFIDVKYPGSCKGDNQLLQQPDDQQIPTASQQCGQMDKYYITLKDLKNILQKDLGLNVTSNKNPDQRNKIVWMRTLIEMLKKKWKKIQTSL